LEQLTLAVSEHSGPTGRHATGVLVAAEKPGYRSLEKTETSIPKLEELKLIDVSDHFQATPEIIGKCAMRVLNKAEKNGDIDPVDTLSYFKAVCS
jgi:hypothetical protein